MIMITKIGRFGVVGALAGALALLPLACTDDPTLPPPPPPPPPPAQGFGEVFGTLVLADGQPASERLELTDCEPPGPRTLWAGLRSGEDGTFRVQPRWAFEDPPMPSDTVRVRCVLRVMFGNWASAPVEVIVTRLEDERIPVRVDLQEGDTVPLGDPP